VKRVLRFVLVGLFLGFFGKSISAQSITFVMPSSHTSPATGDSDPVVVPDNWSLGTDYSGTFYGGSSSDSGSSSTDSDSGSASDNSSNGYAHGDADFVASTYMDYDAAVALGKEILAKQQSGMTTGQTDPSVSVAQAARELKLKAAIPEGPNCLILDQDDSGKLVVCTDGTSSCRPVSE
jgi:hypothetical protein